MQAFTDCRKVLGDGGYLIVETAFIDKREEAVLIFNGLEQKYNEPFTYFIPTRSALTGMANLAGFEVVMTRVLSEPKRITILLQAASRDQLCASDNVAQFIKQMLKRDLCDNSFRHVELENLERSARDVCGRIGALPAFREIDPRKEDVSFPFHLRGHDKGFGRTQWEEETGNTKIL